MFRFQSIFGSYGGLMAAIAIVFLTLSFAGDAHAQRGLDPALIQELEGGQVPGNVEGSNPVSDKWRAYRQGAQGNVSIPDKKAGVIIQSEGETWRNFRNGPLSTYSVWAMAGMIILLCLFFLFRGRIKVEHGMSGVKVTRFNGVERFGHWLLAVSFIILTLTGLNVLYGRYFLPQILGPDLFGQITLLGKYLHNYLGFAFMVALVIVFVQWLAHNFPNRHDLIWVLKGGGMFSKNSHPPAKKFNAGQKILFWLVILGGISISLSGWSLLFPFEYPMFAKTFAFLNNFGFDLRTDLTPIEEMQYAQLWHTMVAVFLTCVILAHIYIGSIGMQGAFDAMGSGDVDKNWAKEHHSVWVEELEEEEKRADGSKAPAPAE